MGISTQARMASAWGENRSRRLAEGAHNGPRVARTHCRYALRLCDGASFVSVNSGLDAYNAFVADNPLSILPGLLHGEPPRHRMDLPLLQGGVAHAAAGAFLVQPDPFSHDILAGSPYTYAEGTVWGHVDGTDHGNIGTTIPVTDVLRLPSQE